MPTKKKPKKLILHALNEEPEGLGFNTLCDKLRKKAEKEGYYNFIGSRNTVSNLLKSMLKEEKVERDIDTRKYRVTEKGKNTLRIFDLLDRITSSSFMDTKSPSDWQSELMYLFIDAEGKVSDSLIELAYNRFGEHVKSWAPDINKIVKAKGLDQKDLEKMWDQLFGNVNAIIIVEMLDPRLMFKRLQQEVEKCHQ